jgi:hypothetical protein
MPDRSLRLWYPLRTNSGSVHRPSIKSHNGKWLQVQRELSFVRGELRAAGVKGCRIVHGRLGGRLVEVSNAGGSAQRGELYGHAL